MAACRAAGVQIALVTGDHPSTAKAIADEVGLYLPRWAVEKESVQVGRVVACGPGIPVAEPSSLEEEPWKTSESAARYVPMQAQVGDYAIFLRKAAVEVKFEGRTYLIVPQAAILLLHRNPRPRTTVEDLLEAEDFGPEADEDEPGSDNESDPVP